MGSAVILAENISDPRLRIDKKAVLYPLIKDLVKPFGPAHQLKYGRAFLVAARIPEIAKQYSKEELTRLEIKYGEPEPKFRFLKETFQNEAGQRRKKAFREILKLSDLNYFPAMDFIEFLMLTDDPITKNKKYDLTAFTMKANIIVNKGKCIDSKLIRALFNKRGTVFWENVNDGIWDYFSKMSTTCPQNVLCDLISNPDVYPKNNKIAQLNRGRILNWYNIKDSCSRSPRKTGQE